MWSKVESYMILFVFILLHFPKEIIFSLYSIDFGLVIPLPAVMREKATQLLLLQYRFWHSHPFASCDEGESHTAATSTYTLFAFLSCFLFAIPFTDTDAFFIIYLHLLGSSKGNAHVVKLCCDFQLPVCIFSKSVHTRLQSYARYSSYVMDITWLVAWLAIFKTKLC